MVPSLSNEKKKKVISYTPGAFALNKTLGFYSQQKKGIKLH